MPINSPISWFVWFFFSFLILCRFRTWLHFELLAFQWIEFVCTFMLKKTKQKNNRQRKKKQYFDIQDAGCPIEDPKVAQILNYYIQNRSVTKIWILCAQKLEKKKMPRNLYKIVTFFSSECKILFKCLLCSHAQGSTNNNNRKCCYFSCFNSW